MKGAYSFCLLCFALLMQAGQSQENQQDVINTSQATNKTDTETTNTTSKTTYTTPGTTTQETMPNHSTQCTCDSTSAKREYNKESPNPPHGKDCLFSLKDDKQMILLLVIAALVLACFALLVTTMILSCQVCNLRRQSSNVDRAKATPTQRHKDNHGDPTETCVMMTDTTEPEEDKQGKEVEEKPEEETAEASTEVQACAAEPGDSEKGGSAPETTSSCSPGNGSAPKPAEEGAAAEASADRVYEEV